MPAGEIGPQVRTKKHQSKQRLHEARGLLKLLSRMKLLSAIVVFAAACTGDIEDLGPDLGSGGPDMAMSSGDMAMTTGQSFLPQIEADIEMLGCTATACHGTTTTPVLKTGDNDNNYTNFTAEAMMGEMSNVLQKNLATSQLSHSIKPFQTTNDPIYQRWLAWIMAGNPKGP
jgi:hypothetical protein